MYLIDYHLHSRYSFDGSCELRDICDTAIERGINEIAITDHMDLYTDKPYEYILDCKNLYEELAQIREEYRGKLKVLLGAEYGQPQINKAEALRFIEDYPLDFIIGSVHNLTGDVDLAEVDYHETDYRKTYEEYLNWVYDLAADYEYDVLGHVNYPCRYFNLQLGIEVDQSRYKWEFSDIFRKVIERGKGIELNLSGIARGMKDTMPDMYLLKLYRELGGEIITVGSDAHLLEHVGVVSRKGYEMLKEAGFSYVTVYDRRKPDFISLKNI